MTLLDGSRIALRQLQKADVTQDYVGWMNDPEINRYLESRHDTLTLADCQKFVEDRLADAWLFGIFVKDGGRHVGNIKLGSINRLYQRGDVGYLIGDRSCWGQGIATEAVGLVTRFGFGQLGLHRIEAGCYADNLASLRVLMKSGYTVEGFMRDYCILDGRWQGCFKLAVLNDKSLPANA